MQRKLHRIVTGVLALATASAGLFVAAGTAGATAATAGMPIAGGVTITPASGNFGVTRTIATPSGTVCPGSATQGWRSQAFLIPYATDLATVTYTGSGPSVAGAQPLYDPTGNPLVNASPAAGTGLMTPMPNQSQFNVSAIAPGNYWVGYACTQSGVTGQYTATEFGPANAGKAAVWATAVTVTATGLTVGIAPSAPNLTAANSSSQTCTAVFTPGTTPGTSYTATANPGAISVSGSGSPITIPGLTNNTAYTITVDANAAGFPSATSNALPCTPVAGARTNVTGLAVTPGAPGSGNATVSWTAPAANTPAATPVSYSVVVTGPSPSTTSVPFGTNTLALTSLSAGNYNVTVTAVYADSPTSGSPAATTSFVASPSSIVLQDIDVTRPVGSLVLTQVCSSNALIPAETAASLGFPTPLPAVPALNPSTVNSPTQTGLAPTLIEDGVRPGNNDPRFAEYPYPADVNGVANPTYPTHCGIDLGKARFVTRGPGAGQFFAASGVIDEITIVDTRDDDAGWNVTGTMGTFSANGNTDSFSGSQLGWTPQATENTGAFTDSLGNTYDQQTTAGPVVAPNSPAASGLSSGKLLLSAAAGSGLGTAIGDARLKLLIPVTADAGLYQGTLTLSAA
jgi:hypothetical protein